MAIWIDKVEALGKTETNKVAVVARVGKMETETLSHKSEKTTRISKAEVATRVSKATTLISKALLKGRATL